MSAVVVGADTFAATDFASSLFRSLPYDSRFTRKEYRQLSPVASLESQEVIDFFMPGLMSKLYFCYFRFLYIHNKF